MACRSSSASSSAMSLRFVATTCVRSVRSRRWIRSSLRRTWSSQGTLTASRRCRIPAAAAVSGTFTGASGSNVAALPRSFTSVGGDTQLLGNFEYRIPIIGDVVSLAAFADIGTAFNLRSKSDQQFSSEFPADQPFLSTVGASLRTVPEIPLPVPISLSSLALCNNPLLAASRFRWESGGPRQSHRDAG